ncbi:MAG: carboxypeptidase regulatory-like domain-containing protein, partial [Bacteroidetes bacterium]|nr:carboxypeptidase regulatory-like domain-containing protein [Bacteroidota bacterium]
MRRLFAVLSIFLMPAAGIAQSAVIKGKVTGEQGNLLSGALVYPVEDILRGVSTDSEGKYSISLAPETSYHLVFRLQGFLLDTIEVRLKAGETRTINHVLSKKITDISGFEVVDKVDQELGITRLDPKIIKSIVGPGGGIEMALKTLPGVHSNNELSSQYSVRGGNYDENLVYVNDVEIYRPFLVRSGQQEGLSFANPAMVQDLRFSAGGFEAKYGDKMSSVLDITYKRPKEFAGSAEASVLGGNLQLEGATKNYRLSGMVGARYRTTQYLLKSL